MDNILKNDNRAYENSGDLIYINIDRIIENPNQPRQKFNEDSLNELMLSIKEYGVLQPISVRKINSFTYELIAGERRLRAAKLAGIDKIPAMIVDIDDKNSAIIALIENIQRENLGFMEEAESYQKIMEKYNITQEMFSKKIGKSQSAIANKIRVLKLSPVVKKVINDNNLTERHSRALLKIKSENIQLKILKKICDEKLNVKDTEKLIDKYLKTTTIDDAKDKVKKLPLFRKMKDFRILENTVKQSVELMHRAGIDANYKIIEKNDSIEFLIKIPTE